MAYAENTTVSPEKSKAEIERILKRYGATSFAYGYDSTRAMIGFQAKGRQVRFFLPLPQAKDVQYRAMRELAGKLDQETRRRWRALALSIKAKLEMVESQITTFEEEFLAHIVLPGGETVGSWMQPQIKHAYETGEMPPLLPSPQTALPKP